MIHIASSVHGRGRSRRTLCGFWNAPVFGEPGWANKNKLPKELCPACGRLWKGGKR